MYADFAIGNGLSGVIFPGVRADYKLHNIVLPPHIVEKHLELTMVGKFRLHINNLDNKLEPLSIAENLGDFNTNFEWEEVTSRSVPLRP